MLFQKSLKRTSVLRIKWVFSNTKYDLYKYQTCTEVCEAFTFLMENIYVQSDCMVYQQIVGISFGTNCAPLVAFFLLWDGVYVKIQKSQRFDPIDKFNDTSRYLYDIFTIDNPEFAKHISDIHVYLTELQLNTSKYKLSQGYRYQLSYLYWFFLI